MAQSVSVPGVGNLDIPDTAPQPVKDALASPQVQGVLNQAPPEVKQAVANAVAAVSRPGAPLPAMPAMPAMPGANPLAAAPSAGERALAAAQTRVGTPYVWGGSNPGGFDCSGLVKWAYGQAGVQTPRTSFEQAHFGAPVPLAQLQPGDIVITRGGGHAALYAGNGRILQAPQTGQSVSYAPLNMHDIYTARRI
ncbi:MAG: C40 family peptidase [Mycobacteriaceae bacterium]|nr:C40 family peptidase [Mycobacteriaceae bacterium]